MEMVQVSSLLDRCGATSESPDFQNLNFDLFLVAVQQRL